ncbi:RNA dependent RNA polymerase-domain-containing protein [Aspergillus karnatakaensis]|uniref:RNA dependent RNA polymerase n=1 Tax=Aspergillus karnatakaensis TaxID=1810916 RepID=UPI003CCDC45D
MSRPPRIPRGPMPPRLPRQLRAPWEYWSSLLVIFPHVPREIIALDLWKSLKNEGNIDSIDIFEDNPGRREAKIRFRQVIHQCCAIRHLTSSRPPPQNDFWTSGTRHITRYDGTLVELPLRLDRKPNEPVMESPVRPGVKYPEKFEVPLFSLDIGVLVGETTMMSMRTVQSSPASLVLDSKHKNMLIYFQLSIAGTNQEYRLKVRFSQLDKFFQARNASTRGPSHLTFLGSPPVYDRRIRNIEDTFVEETLWRESDTWFRQAQVVHNARELATLPVSLRRQNHIIDIGRWTALRINYVNEEGGKLSELCDILRDHNLAVEITDRFTVDDDKRSPIWTWIDIDPRSSSLQDLINSNHVHLPFSVRYQLEVCISHAYLSEFNMTEEFALRLAGLDEAAATKLLEHVALEKRVYFSPMEIFDIKFVKGARRGRIPSHCCQMRSARVTPSTVYYNVPSVDVSNRVIRRYIDLADNFLRVRFTDEKHLGRIHGTANNTMDEVFTRIKRALANGITIGSTCYDFLAFGNSQFREHGAYFFAPKDGVTAASIRAWMGQFSHIRNVAKHAARLGQCFSTTRPIVNCTVDTKRIDDITRNGYTFSDGVGKISPFVAQIATSDLNIKTPTGEPPSAYQFRQGGSKGMLIVSPDACLREIHIRESQFKFEAGHRGLEIIRWSQFSLATLNRQLIIILSTRGIPDSTFHLKLKTMQQNLDEAMQSDPKAVYFLRKYVDPNQATLTLSQMVLDGFRRSNEPFVTSLLTLWRAWHLKSLKEKARIVLDKGACLLGCMDETSTLKGYFGPPHGDTSDERVAALPEIFVQVHRPESGKYEIIEGLCILARNPSLHPGDIRVVRAVNNPALKHLKDVVVLPQTGIRDVASMCSGGDLDGDDYLVIWDQDLLPDDWFCEPMNYTSRKAHDLDHDVTVDEITSFFVTYMKNDSLPLIAVAHLAWADFLPNGVNDTTCVQLAQLHSDAVDYNKTGNPAILKRKLQPRKWPHFMERRNANATYFSRKILGQLYDAVERVDFMPSLETHFDSRILDCQIDVTEALYKYARELKDEYDTAVRRIMAQHEIKTEFEVWSTFVLSHSNLSKDFKYHEEIGAISSALKQQFKERAYELVGGRTFELLAPLVVAMYRTTHSDMAAALAKYRAETPLEGPRKIEQLPLISFPWIFSSILGKIAVGHYEQSDTLATPSASVDVHNEGMAGKAMHMRTTQSIAGSKADKDLSGFEKVVEIAIVDPLANNHAPLEDDEVDSLEKLLDFGPLKSPSTRSSSLVVSSTPVKEGALLDVDLDSVKSGWEARFKTAAELKENQPVGTINIWKSGVVEVTEESDEDENIVGIDALNKLAGL